MSINITQLFAQTKQQLIDHIEQQLQPTPESIADTFKAIPDYEKLLTALIDLPIIHTQPEKTESDEPKDTPETPNAEKIKPSVKPETNQPKEKPRGGIFTRNLKGGAVFQDGESIYVPEVVIRTINIEHGDRIEAIPKTNAPGEYWFDIIEKTDNPENKNRVEIRYALVEEQDGMLIVRRSVLSGGENIKIGEYDHAFKLDEYESKRLKLKPGDLIDIAYNPNDLSHHKITWKHHDEYFERTSYRTPLKSGAYKSKAESESAVTIEQTMTNKNILIIGMEARQAEFERAINDRGGELLFLEGMEPEEQFKSRIQKADAVVILISFIRHRASRLAVQLCKELNTPFVVIDTFGIQSIIDGVESILKDDQ